VTSTGRQPDRAKTAAERLSAAIRTAAERTESEELRHVNRTLRALSKSSHAMLHATCESELLEEVCRIVVEDCGHALVWVGFAEEDVDKSIRPAAHAGFETGYLDTLRLTWADTERGRGPTGTAIRTGVPSYCTNMRTDPRLAPWREEAMRRGYASSVAVPLIADGRAFGALTIYARDPDPFSEDEKELLVELANDLAHGITTLRLRASRARAEEALRESEQRHRAVAEALRESDRHKTEFLASLSHELRNPLAAIRDSQAVLAQAPADSEQARTAREVERRQLDHLVRLVDELLDVTRISRGKITLKRTRTELRAVVERTCEDHRALLERRGVALRTELPAHPVWIDGDPTRIAQVLGNLLQNAGKFTPCGGSARVALSCAGGAAELRVADDGIGIEPALLDALFEPFVQGERGLARAQGGLGLGLALVRGLVELHGGSVRAHSPGIGGGSEFVVALPLAGEQQPAAPPAPPVERSRPGRSQARPRSILVVEDYADAAQSLADVLSLRGHRVEVAATGEAGIARARELTPEFVLCDIGLPDVDGYDVARTLRADPRLRSTFLVALSGYAQAEDRDRAAKAGFDAHLAKPAPLDQLDRLLAREI
jgi:signal transduction histidine kinase